MESSKRKAIRLPPKRSAAVRNPGGRRLAVFTSIDGTLLDARTFDASASKRVVERLLAAQIPVVPVSVMTLDELVPVAAELGLKHAMIIEAGGAIARWTDGGWDVEQCGPPAETLLDVIRKIEDRSGADLLVYSALSDSEAARISGRSGDMLQASTHRNFSEPFVIENGDLEEVKRSAASIGFSIRQGRRFLHLSRECDLGEAFSRVREELQCETAVALGSSAVDADFLKRADVPIIVPGPDGSIDPKLHASFPRAVVAPAPGPAGWASAVEAIWPELIVSKKRAK